MGGELEKERNNAIRILKEEIEILTIRMMKDSNYRKEENIIKLKSAKERYQEELESIRKELGEQRIKFHDSITKDERSYQENIKNIELENHLQLESLRNETKYII